MEQRCTPDAPRGLSRRALRLLREPLDPALVSEREAPDGGTLSYLEGWAAIDQANRIFGHDGWGAELVGEVGFRPLASDPMLPAPPAVGMFTATVRVTMRGCQPHSDVGCGLVAAETPEAYEVAYKGAVTDALKRGLRHLGDQFGNRLYAGHEPTTEDRPAKIAEHTDTVPEVPAARMEASRLKVLDLAARMGGDEAKAREWVRKRYDCDLGDLDGRQLADAIRSLAAQLNRRKGEARAA